jgi:hypothetical protein
MTNESRPQRPHIEHNMTKGFAFRPLESDHSKKAEQLAQMGFDKARALEILDIVDGNLESAVDMLSP